MVSYEDMDSMVDLSICSVGGWVDKKQMTVVAHFKSAYYFPNLNVQSPGFCSIDKDCQKQFHKTSLSLARALAALDILVSISLTELPSDMNQGQR